MSRARRMTVALLGLTLLASACVAGRAQVGPGRAPTEEERLTRILDLAGKAVERYHAELFRIAFTETLRHEELREDMTAKRAREYAFDTIVAREELSADEEDYYPKAVRRLRTVDGKTGKRAKGSEALAGLSVSSLHFFMPKYRGLYEYALEGEEKLDGRDAFRIRVMRLGQGEPKVEWRERLVGMRFHAFVPSVITAWVDAQSYDVLRVESRLVAPFEFESPRSFGAGPFGRFGPSRRMKYARHDYAVRFRRESFKDPEQTLLVPERAEWLVVIEGASKPRQRSTLRFSDYRRYRSDVKVIEEEEPQ